jgi:WD40 repeat protein
MPEDDKVLASVDYAGMVSVWDVRTSVPLSNMEVHEGKGFAIDWTTCDQDNKRKIVSGGSDCCLKSITLNL